MKKILLVGCGNIGSRHLQSLCNNKEPYKITVVEPNVASVERAKAIIGEGAFARIEWVNQIDQAPTPNNLCIIATAAAQRKELLMGLLERKEKQFLIEKLVAQSSKGYGEVLEAFQKNNAKGWVNFTRRYSLYYQRLRSVFEADNQPISLMADAGNLGLACGAIHLLDLFLFLDRSARLELVGEPRDLEMMESKREGYIDFSGNLLFRSENGSLLGINFTRDDFYPMVKTIRNGNKCFLTEPLDNLALFCRKEDNWKWKPVDDVPLLPYISELTSVIVNDIFSKGICALPTLEESFYIHKALLDILLDEYCRVHGNIAEELPVT